MSKPKRKKAPKAGFRVFTILFTRPGEEVRGTLLNSSPLVSHVGDLTFQVAHEGDSAENLAKEDLTSKGTIPPKRLRYWELADALDGYCNAFWVIRNYVEPTVEELLEEGRLGRQREKAELAATRRKHAKHRMDTVLSYVEAMSRRELNVVSLAIAKEEVRRGLIRERNSK